MPPALAINSGKSERVTTGIAGEGSPDRDQAYNAYTTLAKIERCCDYDSDKEGY